MEKFEENILANEAFKLIPMRGSTSLTYSKSQGVTLNGGTIVRPILAGGRVVWTLDLDFTSSDSKGTSRPVARLGFVLADQTILMANFSAKSGGTNNTQGDLGFELEKNGAPTDSAKPLRAAFHECAFAKGVWHLEYNQGMIRVQSPDGTRYSACTLDQHGLMIPVIGLAWTQLEGNLRCKSMGARGTSLPPEPSPAAAADLRKASTLNDRAAALARGGQGTDAVTLMQESSALFLKHRGELSRDYANSLDNLARFQSWAGLPNKAFETQQLAMAHYRKVLGPDHPQLVIAAGGLIEVLTATGRVAEAIPELENAARVCKLVGGEADSLGKTFSEISKGLKSKQISQKWSASGNRSTTEINHPAGNYTKNWRATFFPWATATDPIKAPDQWKSLGTDLGSVCIGLDNLDIDFVDKGPVDILPELGRQAGIGAENFGMIATSTMNLSKGRWKITVDADDGVRVLMNNKVVIEEWSYPRREQSTATWEQPADGEVAVRVEYFENGGWAKLRFNIEKE